MTEPQKLTLKDWETKFTLKNGRLFYQDEPVQTGVKLDRAQFFWAVLAAIATVASAFANVWSVFFKKTPPATVSHEPSESSASKPPATNPQ